MRYLITYEYDWFYVNVVKFRFQIYFVISTPFPSAFPAMVNVSFLEISLLSSGHPTAHSSLHFLCMSRDISEWASTKLKSPVSTSASPPPIPSPDLFYDPCSVNGNSDFQAAQTRKLDGILISPLFLASHHQYMSSCCLNHLQNLTPLTTTPELSPHCEALLPVSGSLKQLPTWPFCLLCLTLIR